MGIELKNGHGAKQLGHRPRVQPGNQPGIVSAAALAAQNFVVLCFFGSFTSAPDSKAKLSHVPTSWG